MVLWVVAYRPVGGQNVPRGPPHKHTQGCSRHTTGLTDVATPPDCENAHAHEPTHRKGLGPPQRASHPLPSTTHAGSFAFPSSR